MFHAPQFSYTTHSKLTCTCKTASQWQSLLELPSHHHSGTMVGIFNRSSKQGEGQATHLDSHVYHFDETVSLHLVSEETVFIG